MICTLKLRHLRQKSEISKSAKMSAECGPPPVLPHVSLISWTFIQSRLEVHICCYRAETEGDEMPHTDTEVCVKPSKMHFWFIDAEKSILFKFSFNLNQVCSWLGQTTCLIIVTFHPSYLHITHVHDCYRMDWLGYIYGYLQSEAHSEDTQRQPIHD